MPITRATRAAFASLDGVDLMTMFRTRACIMKSPPHVLESSTQVCKLGVFVDCDSARRQQFRYGRDVEAPVFPPQTSGRIASNTWCTWASCQQLAWRWKVIRSHLGTTPHRERCKTPRKRPSVPREPLPREASTGACHRT